MSTHEGTGCGCSFPDGPLCPVYRDLAEEKAEARLDLYDAEDELKRARGEADRLLAQQKVKRARARYADLSRRKKKHRRLASGPVPIPGGIA